MKKLVLSLAAVAFGVTASAAVFNFPEPPKVEAPTASTAKIILAGGCFWGVEGVFEHVKGVTGTVVGYDGGKKETAHYERIEEGDTNHAESVEITYDPKVISLGEIYKIYFSAAHDPTTLNRQHHDVGTQYRSAIFYTDEQQKQLAEAYIKQLNDAHVFKSPVVTKVVPNTGFFRAEDYHQHYLDQVVACDAKMTVRCSQLNVGYIKGVDYPLLNSFKQMYPEYYKQ